MRRHSTTPNPGITASSGEGEPTVNFVATPFAFGPPRLLLHAEGIMKRGCQIVRTESAWRKVAASIHEKTIPAKSRTGARQGGKKSWHNATLPSLGGCVEMSSALGQDEEQIHEQHQL
jgi:hypothetical protein